MQNEIEWQKQWFRTATKLLYDILSNNVSTVSGRFLFWIPDFCFNQFILCFPKRKKITNNKIKNQIELQNTFEIFESKI